mgnify:CR=1 FL=1
MSDKDIREKIRTRRKELGLSLEEVAKKVKILRRFTASGMSRRHRHRHRGCQ